MAYADPLTALFLGAGASFDLGMPLVWELTDEIKNWLTPAKLRSLNQGWRLQGQGHPDHVIDALAAALENPDYHYEVILGSLEVRFRRNGPDRRHYHHLYSWLVDLVSYLLQVRHVKNRRFIERNLRWLKGVEALAVQNRPLWIFSLNHDLIVECLAAQLGLSLNCGFEDERMSLPRRDTDGQIVGELTGRILRQETLETKGLPFLQPGRAGLNLLKIHGALDVFTVRDGRDLLKIEPVGEGASGVIESLRIANEELHSLGGSLEGPQLKVTNEIAYADDRGDLQFLRRTLLSGAFKFDPRIGQVLPSKLLDYFRSNLNYATTLVAIGYGFGDSHINRVIRDWLEFSAQRQLVVVDPFRTKTPPDLLHVQDQVTLRQEAASDYLDSEAGIVRPESELNERRLAHWMRQSGEDGVRKFSEFAARLVEEQIDATATWMADLPLANGDVDLETLGLSLEELLDASPRRAPRSQEALISEFLSWVSSEERAPGPE